MRLGIQPLVNVSSVNDFDAVRQVLINRGETYDLYFQLIDKNKDGLRYIPGATATVLVEIPLFAEAFPTELNVRDVQDNSIRREATAAFADDRSIWTLPLLAEDTANMTSSSIRVTVTDGASVKIAVLDLALIVGPEEKGLL